MCSKSEGLRVAGASKRAWQWVACVLLLAVRPVFAQSGGIVGVAKDPQGAVVAGAQVVLINAQADVRSTTVTDGSGRYGFAPLQPGTYAVEVSAAGFQTARSAEITLVSGESVTRDFSLALAGPTESVTVLGVDQAYRVGAVSSLGSSGSAPILNTPYTVNILPSELIANGQVKTFKEASKYLPLVEFQEMQGSEVLRPATRGMQGSNMQNSRMDGMGIVVTGANSMESLQQIEALNGLGGALYGPANPSGMFNFVPKRPTERPLRQVRFGYDDRSVGTVHADFGGRVGKDGMFGYRANLLAGNGEAFVNNSDSRRRLAALAGDVRPFARTVVEAFYSDYHVVQHGFPGWFTYGRSSNKNAFIELPPDAPDPAREGHGQASAGLDLHSYIGELRVKHDLNTNWHLGIGALDQRADRDISTQVNALTDAVGGYTSSLATGFAARFRVFSNLGYLNGRFATGSVTHDVAIGSTGYVFRTYSDVTNPSAASVLLGSASIANPLVFALPAAGLPQHNNIYLSSTIHQQGFNAADTATFNRRWSVRIAASQDWIWTDNYNNKSVRTGGYRANGVSPLASLLFKPVARMTVYGTYGSSLQQGDIAPGTAANSAQALPPYRSTQSEIGYKLALPRIDFSTALFRLNRPFATTDVVDNVFKISGAQVNYGVEAMLTGRVADTLVMYGGVTVLDPSLTKTGNPSTDGKQFVGIPRYKSNLLTEYRLPVGVGTFLSLNWQSVARRAIDDINSTWTPAYNVFDLGMRFAHSIRNTVATWRLTVNNVSDVHYWSSLGPGNITGTNVGSYTAHLGAPRTIATSVELKF
jgi:iron complex outermembrane receptor protein